MKRQMLAVAALLTLSASRPAIGQQPLRVYMLDAQYLDSTEFLITSEELRWNGDFVAVGRRLALPTATSRGRTQFLVMSIGAGWQTGDRAWTNQFYETRPARHEDIVEGKMVFCFNATENGVFRGPRSRAEALGGSWWATTITDTLTLFRNEVKAGNTRLNVSCLRVLK